MDRQMGTIDSSEAKPRIQSIARGFAVLFVIARSEHGLKAKDIIAEVGLDRQTTYHILQSLTSIGVITRSAENRYILGLRVGELIENFPRHLAPPERLAPLVRSLAQATGETCYAVGWFQDEIVVLSAARGTKSVGVIDIPPGYASNAHARASGKLLLSLADPRQSAEYLKKHELKKLTPRTITKRTTFEKELLAIRTARISIEREEFSNGICCLAVPIGDFGSTYALAMSVPAERFDENLERYKTTIQRVMAAERW
jgi:DNA-binding IclR family transcriptional regulator